MPVIRFVRGSGDTPGGEIFEPMLSDAALTTRGKSEMDKNSTRFTKVDAEIIYNEGITLGSLVTFQDPTVGETNVAKVTGISIEVTEGSTEMHLVLEKPVI